MAGQVQMIVDVALCMNCSNCVLANKDEHVGNAFPGYAAPMPRHGAEWISIERRTRGEGHHVDTAYLVTMCNHCADAPCMKAAPEVISRRPDGIVVIDPVAAKGRRDLVPACPYGHIHWNAEDEVAQAWTFDPHLLDQGWHEPRASHACPTEALKVVRLPDAAMAQKAAEEGLQTLHPERGTRPRIWYRNLHRFSRDFLGGTVMARQNGVTDVVVDALVVLRAAGQEIAQTRSDHFGDFRFDGLLADGRMLEVIASAGTGRASATAALTDTVVLPPLVLE